MKLISKLFFCILQKIDRFIEQVRKGFVSTPELLLIFYKPKT